MNFPGNVANFFLEGILYVIIDPTWKEAIFQMLYMYSYRLNQLQFIQGET